MKRGYKEKKVVSVLFNTTRVFLNLTSEEACASYITTVCDKFDSKVDSGLKAFTYEDFVGLYHSFCITEEESMPSDVHNRLEHTCNRAYDITGALPIGDGKSIKGGYWRFSLRENPSFSDLKGVYKRHDLYKTVLGARTEEQCDITKKSIQIVRNASKLDGMPKSPKQWETLCEAVRLDNALCDPGNMLMHTLHFERPNMVKEYGRLHETVGAYLKANGLPAEYEDLVSHAKEQVGGIKTCLIDIEPKTQFDVPFDKICDYAKQEHVEVYQYDAARRAIREAWLIDKMGPAEKETLQAAYCDRLYTMLHSDVPDVTGAGKFFERLQTEATRAFCLVDGRHRNYPDNASFLGETFKAYSEAREQSELAKQGNMLDLGMALSDLESEMKAHGLEA